MYINNACDLSFLCRHDILRCYTKHPETNDILRCYTEHPETIDILRCYTEHRETIIY